MRVSVLRRGGAVDATGRGWCWPKPRETVCRGCGKRSVPNLAALLDLAHVAERVGKQCRHLLTPSMESLLDLARAAENYCTAAPRSGGVG